MLASIWSFFGFKETPPPVNIIGVRIPTDRSVPHLVALRTTSDGVDSNIGSRLFHIPDLRPYWGSGTPWQWRDIYKFELKKPASESCNGVYYVFFSFAMDDLPENLSVPKFPDEEHQKWWGDVFIVKVLDPDYWEPGWAKYEDVPREFLDLPIMRTGGLGRIRANDDNALR
jgi:hypothetical protein